MDSPRRRRKLRIFFSFFASPRSGGVLLGLILACLPPPPAALALTERIVIDRHTGLAIFGFDPVAYFTDASPLMGRPDFEYRFAGAIWRFRNDGNRAAFARDPDVYMPRYGGYDPVALTHGVAAPGNPLVWLVFRERLYFFLDQRAREGFSADPRATIAAADANWPEVRHQLVP